MPETAATATPAALAGLALAVPAIYRAGLAGLEQAWFARLRPCDTAERAAAQGFVAQIWLAHRLDALEERLIGALIEGRPVDGLPSLATLVRRRARLERDRQTALADLETARSTPPLPWSEAVGAGADGEPAAASRSSEISEPADIPEPPQPADIPLAEEPQAEELAEHAAPEPDFEVASAATAPVVHAAPEPEIEAALAAFVAPAHEGPEPFTRIPGQAVPEAACTRRTHAAPEPDPAVSPSTRPRFDPIRETPPLRATG